MAEAWKSKRGKGFSTGFFVLPISLKIFYNAMKDLEKFKLIFEYFDRFSNGVLENFKRLGSF